jgi:hypothetical protein
MLSRTLRRTLLWPLLGVLLWASFSAACAAQTTWARNADWLAEQIADCAQEQDIATCRTFSARALARLFGVLGVCDDRRCMNSLQLSGEIAKSAAWKPLGAATEQSVLTMAQQMAVGGLPVVAVNAAVGWVVLVMPGDLYPSQRWRRNVPAAAGTRLDQPDGSVYGKGLNFLFSDPTKVTLYVYK